MTSVSVSVVNLWPSFDQLPLQRNVVFDDAVVSDNNPAFAVPMRMRVFFSRTAVRCPARMAQTELPGQRAASPEGLRDFSACRKHRRT